MNQMHFAKPPITKVNKILMITVVSIFLVSSFLDLAMSFSINPILTLSLSGILKGYLFQIITYPLIQGSLMSVLFNCLLLWFIGGELEIKWGSALYIKFLIASNFGAGIVYLLSSYFIGGSYSNIPLSGLDGINLSLLIAYGIIYSDRTMSFMLIFPMQAKYFCMLLAGIQIYLGIFSSNRYSAWAHITAMAWGYLFLKWKSFRSGFPKKKKGHLKLVSEKEEDKDPRFWQ